MKVITTFLTIIFTLIIPAVLAAYKVKGGSHYEQDTLPAVLSGHGLVTRMVLDAFDLDELELEQCERTRTVPGFKLGGGILDVTRFYKYEDSSFYLYLVCVAPVASLCFKWLIHMKFAQSRLNAQMKSS